MSTTTRKAVKYFFILPQEAIIFMNSDEFIGLLILDATFMKHYSKGRYFEVCTYNPSHKINSNGSEFVNQVLTLIKNNIEDGSKIKTIISDESPDILKSINDTFPHANVIKCICIYTKLAIFFLKKL